MANQIDIDSINLSTEVPNQYFADYIASPAPAPETLCALPPLVSSVIQKKELIPLKPACSFTFPDVTVIPPFYNPPIVIPKVNIPDACEVITVESNVETCPGTDKSKLTLTSVGPKSRSGINECKLSLEGLICVEACIDFEASADVFFKGAARNSSIDIASSPAPNCGLILTGDIDVQACETFSATSNIQFFGASKDSVLLVEAKSIPDCGIDISGIINTVACERFQAQTDIRFTGKAVKKANFELQSMGTPDCGFALVGAVDIQACVDFKVSSEVKIVSNLLQPHSYFSFYATQAPDCGLTVDAYLDFKDICPSFSIIDPYAEDREANKKQFDKSKHVKVPPPGHIQVLGNVVASNSLQFKKQDYPECALGITGELVLDACKDFSLTTETEGGTIYVYGCSGEVGKIELRPELIIEDLKITKIINSKLPATFPGNKEETTDPCRKKLKLKLNSGFISLCSSTTNNSLSMCAGTGKPADRPGAPGGCGSNGAGGPTCATSTGGGGGGSVVVNNSGGDCCCYYCNSTTSCQTELILDKLFLNKIETSPCCTLECKNTIDLCDGKIT